MLQCYRYQISFYEFLSFFSGIFGRKLNRSSGCITQEVAKIENYKKTIQDFFIKSIFKPVNISDELGYKKNCSVIKNLDPVEERSKTGWLTYLRRWCT